MDRAHRTGNWLRDPVLIAGTVVSVALGVLFYVRPDVGTALGVLAGLIGVTVTLQIQAIVQSRQQAQEIVTAQRQAEQPLLQQSTAAASRLEHIETMLRGARLVSLLQHTAWLLPVMEGIAESWAAIETTVSKELTTPIGRKALEDCETLLSDLGRGHFTTDYADMGMFYALTEQLEHELLATSVESIDLDLWSAPRRKVYWDQQERMLAKGVRITRIFIYENWTDPLHDFAQKNLDLGVNVLAAHRRRLTRDLLKDMVVWDAKAMYEAQVNPDGEPVHNYFSMEPKQVNRAMEVFRRIRDNASTFDGNRF